MTFKPKAAPEYSRLPGESDYKWAHFMYYRDWAYPDGPLGKYRPRNMEMIAAELGLTTNACRASAATGNWQIRAAAYDAELETAKRDRTLGAVARMRVRKERALADWALVLELERAKLLERAQDPEKPALTVAEMTKVEEMVAKTEAWLEGVDRDLPDQKADEDALPLTQLSDETLDRMAAELRTKH